MGRIRSISTRPLAVPEVGTRSYTSSGESVSAKAAWITDYFNNFVPNNSVKMTVWFKEESSGSQMDWMIYGAAHGDATYSGNAVYTEYANGVAGSGYLGSDTGNPRLLTSAQFAGTGGGGGGGTGNCRSGTWCLQGKFSGSPSWNAVWQTANVSSNKTYVATIWLKGTGSVRLDVHAGNWGSTLESVKCTASGSYTQCVTPSFSTGGNTQLTLVLIDAYSTAGTVYLDDTFAGVSGGSNVVGNPGFESGNTVWAGCSGTAQWAIGQF